MIINALWVFPFVGLLVLFLLFLLRSLTYTKNIKDTFNPLLLFTFLFLYFYFVPGVYLFVTGDYVWLSTVSNSEIMTSSLVILLFFVLVASTYIYAPKVEIQGVNININSSDFRYLFLAGLLWIVLGFTGYIIYVWLNGGLVQLLTENRTQFQKVPNTQRYKILAWVGLWGGLPLIIPSAHEISRSMEERHRRKFLFFIGVLFLLITISTISFRSRLKAVYPITVLLLYIHYRVYEVSPKQLGLIATLGTIGVGGFSFVENIINGKGASIQLLMNGIIYRVRVEPLIEVINQVPTEKSFLFGTSLFYGGMWFDSGVTALGNQIELIVTGTDISGFTISGTVIAELYINYGIMGILFFAPIYGFLLKTIKTTLADSDNLVIMGLYPAIIFITLAIIPTSIGWVLRNFVLVVLPPIVATLLVRHLFIRLKDMGIA